MTTTLNNSFADTLDIPQIFIEFNALLYTTFTKKLGDTVPHEECIKYIQEHNEKLSEILTQSLSTNIPQTIIHAWFESLKSKINAIERKENTSFYGHDRKAIQQKIEVFLNSSQPYFSMYQTLFLPLEEKLKLGKAIEKSPESGQKVEKKTPKI